MSNLEDVFERGLHHLSANALIQLADSQQFLLSEVSSRDLVYLIQELAFRLSDALDGNDVSKDMIEGAHGVEYNGG